MENIPNRGHNYEQSIELSYFEDIKEGYLSYFVRKTDFPVLKVDTSTFDFIKKSSDYHLIRCLIYGTKHPGIINRIFFDGETV